MASSEAQPGKGMRLRQPSLTAFTICTTFQQSPLHSAWAAASDPVCDRHFLGRWPGPV